MMEYAGKLCLAPMVRSGELPTRLMALKYGAQLVWSPEVIDRKIRTCTRRINPEFGTVEYVEPGKSKNSVVFRTDRAKEQGKLIFQIGSADPAIAVEGALKVIEDVDGVDLNCGCPKPFSTHGGMGAALLKTPDKLCSILSNLVEKVGVPHGKPISAKIRLLHAADPAPTLELVEKICKTGIKNLTVHCRTPSMRNREEPIYTFILDIYGVVKRHDISLIVNGGFTTRADFEAFRKQVGIPQIGGMFAEAAESNPTIFSDSPKPWHSVIREFIATSAACGNHPINTKYIMLNQIPGKLKFYQLVCKKRTHEEFAELAASIDDEDAVFIRTKQKDRQYPVKKRTLEETNPEPAKRPALMSNA